MEKKSINHKEIEYCRLSKKPINTTKEKYVILLECEGKDIYSVGFYKGELLTELIKGNLDLIQKELMERHKKLAGGMIQKLKSVMNPMTN